MVSDTGLPNNMLLIERRDYRLVYEHQGVISGFSEHRRL